ncbi:MAG TPA: CDP-archaeol synthase [Stellaceae bacterium]|nr:CDP-archaeol synthase [Stellaceae bacterium]
MQFVLLLKLLALLAVANGTPLFAKKIFGRSFAWPIDAGLRLWDERPLFGASKTIRGIVLAVALSAAVAPLLGLDAWLGLAVGAGAMAGDLFSSFCKRRAGMKPSSRATGLDQIPECLLPLLLCRLWLDLSGLGIALGVAAFFLGEIVLSRLLHQLRLREQPY